jgi:hypothetical protein
MITSKTEIAVEAVASTSALVTHASVGACVRLSVCATLREWILAFNFAIEVSLSKGFVGSVNHEVRLTTMSTLSSVNDPQHLLFSGVVPVSEEYLNESICRGISEVNINLNLRYGEVGKSLQGILNGISILLLRKTYWINLDWAGIVLATELIDKAELEETFCRWAI